MWSNIVNQVSDIATQAANQASEVASQVTQHAVSVSETIQKETDKLAQSLEQNANSNSNDSTKNDDKSSESSNKQTSSNDIIDPLNSTCPTIDGSADISALTASESENLKNITTQADEMADKIFSLASTWAGKAMTVANDVSNKTQEKLKEAQQSELAVNLKAQSKLVTDSVVKTIEDKTILGDFHKEQQQQISKNTETEGESTGCPWEGYEDFEVLKEQILNLSTDKRTFVRNPPAGVNFSFDYNKASKQAIAILNEDENLRKMRFELVPKQIKEANFWKNYFYRVSLIKQSFNLKQISKSNTSLNKPNTDSEINTEMTLSMKSLDNNKNNNKTTHAEEESHEEEPQFVSTEFNNEITAEDLQAEMKALGMDGGDGMDEDWEKQLTQELAEYEMVNEEGEVNSQDTSEWEKEVNDMLG